MSYILSQEGVSADLTSLFCSWALTCFYFRLLCFHSDPLPRTPGVLLPVDESPTRAPVAAEPDPLRSETFGAAAGLLVACLLPV